jgi:hypothetical protein
VRFNFTDRRVRIPKGTDTRDIGDIKDVKRIPQHQRQRIREIDLDRSFGSGRMSQDYPHRGLGHRRLEEEVIRLHEW